jgi:uncharacterized Zn-finger protein
MAIIIFRLFIILGMINCFVLKAMQPKIDSQEDFNPFGQEFLLWSEGTLHNVFCSYEPEIQTKVIDNKSPELIQEIEVFESPKADYECSEKYKEYKCTWRRCNQSFSQIDQLDQHMSTHPQKTNKCTYPGCIKSYVHEKDLKAHMRTHTGVDYFICPICHATFNYRQSLNNHKSRFHGINS